MSLQSDALQSILAKLGLISGNVGGYTKYISSTVTMSVAGAYASADYMGTSVTPQSFSGVTRKDGGSGIIKSIIISDKITNANVAMELWIFSSTFVAPTDNAAWSITDAESLNVQCVIPISISGWSASANNQVYCDSTINYPFNCASGSSSIYYALVSRGTTPAFTTQDLTINLGILQD